LNEVWFAVSVGSGSSHSLCLVYNYVTGDWTVFDVACNVLGSYVNAVGDTKVLHGDTSGYVHVDESGTSDNGTAIVAYVTSKWFPMVEGNRRGRASKMAFALDGQSAGSSITLKYGYDLSTVLGYSTAIAQGIETTSWDTSFMWDNDVWGESAMVMKEVMLSGYGKFFQWQLYNAALNNTFRCYLAQMGVIQEGS
jgi:hypothetical protein